jgi:DNA-binding NtrC family response regulator
MLIYPVECGPLQSRAYLVAETSKDDQDEDQILLAELARMLAVHWDRVERSSTLYESWETEARRNVEEQLPGTSHAIRVLRDSVLEAARSPYPVLMCGRAGSGRVSAAMLISSLSPSGAMPVQVFRGTDRDDGSLRVELFGAPGEPSNALVERAKAGSLVIHDLERLPQSLQRELGAAIRHDLESGYGPSVRWIATTVEDCMAQVSEGTIDSTLFNVFQRHVIRTPSLEDRREDLPLLIVRLLDSVGSEQGKEIRGIELETLNSLINHTFEGQMTELVAELRRLVSATPDGEMVRGVVPISSDPGTAGSGLDADVAAATLLSQDDLKVVVPAVERLIIDRVLRRTLGNQSKAARILNLSRGALIAKMKEYDVPDYRYLRRSR